MSRGLGRGISALMDDDMPMTPRGTQVSAVSGDATATDHLSVHLLQPGMYQPRHHFDEEALQELAESIRRNGVIQPVLVRPIAENRYEIIAGERRWRASQLAGLTEIPVIIRSLTDMEALEIALVENIQRKDLNPLEEAEGYQRLMDEFNYTQEVLASVIGKSRTHIANMVRLQKLPSEVKALLMEEKLTMGHARALVKAENPIALANEIVSRGLSVRQVEKRLSSPQGIEVTQKPRKPREVKTGDVSMAGSNAVSQNLRNLPKDPDIVVLEETISQNIGLNVAIYHQPDEGGELVIRYADLTELDDVLRRLGGVV